MTSEITHVVETDMVVVDVAVAAEGDQGLRTAGHPPPGNTVLVVEEIVMMTGEAGAL